MMNSDSANKTSCKFQRRRQPLKLIKKELSEVFTKFDLASYLAWTAVKTRYKRSVLGPMWLVLGTAIGVGGLGYLWSSIFKVSREDLVPSLTIGLVSWYLLSTTITESASIFYNNRQLLLNIEVSSLLISLQLLLRQLVNFAHNLIVVAVVLFIYPKYWSSSSLMFFPGLILVCLNLLWIIQLVGYIGARYRDLEPLIAAIMQPLFFITPVIFRPNQVSIDRRIIDFNPLAHLIALIRDPLLGSPPPVLSWIVAAVLALLGWTAALWLTSNKRNRLAYWVH